MVHDADGIGDADEEIKQKIQEIIVENACQEYNNIVKQTLNLINQHLEEGLVQNYTDLEELEEKIAARTRYLEKNPEFLISLCYTTRNIKIATLREFNQIRITLKEHSRRIVDKIKVIETYHQKLYELVIQNSKENLSLLSRLEELEDEFQDCMEKVNAGKEQNNIVEEDPKPKEQEEEKEDIDEASPKDPPNTPEETETEDNPIEQEEKPEEPPSTPKLINKKAPPANFASTDSVDTVTIQKNAFSDLSLNPNMRKHLPNNFQLFPNVVPEVARRRPIENIHKRLMQQLHASDSLEGFIRLMGRKPTDKSRGDKPIKNEDLEDKYAGSLWFFPAKKKTSKTTLSTSSSQKSAKVAKTSTCCNLLVTSSQQQRPCVSRRERMRKTKSNLEKSKLKYYDLLDDVDCRDLKPIKSEYPRRDNIYTNIYCSQTTTTTTATATSTKIEQAKSYLHWMMDENDSVWRKLLQPTVINPKPELRKRPSAKKKKPSKTTMETPPVENKIKKNSVESPRTTDQQQHHQKKQTPKNNRNVKSLMEYLTSPQQKFLGNRQQTLIVMPVRVFYDNFPTREMPLLSNDLNNIVVPPPPKVPPIDLNPLSPSPKKTEVRQLISPLPIHHFETKTFFKDKPLSPNNKPDSARKKSRGSEDKILLDSARRKSGEDRIPLPLKKKQREMLQQLKGLKVHNDNIQKNIQNAIDVIEAKMIELFSTSSTESSNIEAFNAMEEEISKVLAMIRNNEKKESSKKVEKMEAEKDENTEKTPRLSKGNIMVKEKTSDETKETPPMETPKSKDTFNKETKIISKKELTEKGNEEVRRAANIEEGERLLGQVDNVIKKIDSIYTKFYDPSKGSTLPVKKNALTKVMDFFSNLNNVIEETPKIIEYKTYEQVGEKFEEAQDYQQVKVYHKVKMIEDCFDQKQLLEETRKKEEEFKKKREEEARKKELRRKLEAKAAEKKSEKEIGKTVDMMTKIEQEINKVREIREIKKKMSMEDVRKSDERIKLSKIDEKSEEEDAVVYKDTADEIPLITATNYHPIMKLEDRHESILKLFYAIFFSSVFFALNLDFAAF